MGMEIDKCKKNLEAIELLLKFYPIEYVESIKQTCKYLEELQAMKKIISRWNADYYGFKGKDEYFDMILDVVGEYHG